MGSTKLTKLKSHLQIANPEELYDIEPGQIVFFVPFDGLSRSLALALNAVSAFLNDVHGDNDVKISIVPSSDEVLIGTFAGRNQQEVEIPYKVIVGTGGSIVGFASQFFGEEVEKILAKARSLRDYGVLRIDATELPAIVGIDPKNRPVNNSSGFSGESPDDFGLGWLKKRPETEKEKAEKIQQNEDKIRKILWECAYLGIDIDLKGLVEAVEASNSKSESYELSLKMEPAKAGMIDCKVFVGENLELELTPIQKAIYLTFLSLKDGLVIEEAKPDFTKRIQTIYRFLPNRSEKDDGILHVTYIQSQTLRGVISEANAAIARLIPGGVGLEFAIEGEKNNPYKVMRSTPEIRKQIISAFNLQ